MGLSAASVAGLLPLDVLADDGIEFRRVWVSHPEGRAGGVVRLTVRGIAETAMRFRSGSFQVSGSLGFGGGAEVSFDRARIEPQRGTSRFEMMSRAGPQAVSLTLEPGERSVLGYFHVEVGDRELPTSGEFEVRFSESYAVAARFG